MTKLNWDRVNLENLINKRGAEYIGDGVKESKFDYPTCALCGVVVKKRLSKHVRRCKNNLFKTRNHQSQKSGRARSKIATSASSPLLGAWVLSSIENVNSNEESAGSVTMYGFLVYGTDLTVTEAMMTQPKGSVPAKYWLLTTRELRHFFEEYWSYQGKYRIDEKSMTVIHIIESTSGESLTGGRLERKYEVVGNELVTFTKNSNHKTSKRLRWHRVSKD